MFKNTTVKKSLILLVAALMCVAVFLAACSEKPFTPVTKPTAGKIDSNGGIAVVYGEWIYYVNGYVSDVNADNTYADVSKAPRVGSVVRIKADKLAEILAINDDDTLTSAKKSEKIAQAVRDSAETVVPKIYYTANTTNAELNGLYIFGERLYILTPNEKLTANGDKQTSQSVLMSFALDGSDMQRHFTFANNTIQLWLNETADKKVVATYLDGSELHVLSLGADEKSTVNTPIKNSDGETDSISSVKYDAAKECLFFLDGDGSICKLALGSTEKEIIVDNSVAEGEDESTVTYAISSVNNGFVYFTMSDSNNVIDSGKLYFVNTSGTKNSDGKYVQEEALDTKNFTVYGWNGKNVVYTGSSTSSNGNYTGYGIWIVTSQDGKERTNVLLPGWSKDSITINKIVGDTLFFTAGGVTYTKNLSTFVGAGAEGNAEDLGTPYATSWSTDASVGWAAPDVVTVGEHTYMFTFSTGNVAVVEFDAVKKTNGSSATLTLTAKADED